MEKIKAAVLEDNKVLLKDLKQNLEETNLVEVIVWATNSEEFISKVKSSNIDAVLLDIDLSGDSMSGIDVAHKLKLPVLFVSGKTKEFYQSIEDLNLNSDMVVEHITKPITQEKLTKILPKFIQVIKSINQSQYVYLDFKESKRNKIEINSIVYMETDVGNSGKSNNKKIYFTNRKPEILFDFSFEQMHKIGLSSKQFIKTNRSYRVNADKILKYNTNNNTVEVVFKDNYNKETNTEIPVSDNFKSNFRKWQ